jgi:hypothetical protein
MDWGCVRTKCRGKSSDLRKERYRRMEKITCEQLHDLYFSLKEDEMGGTCSSHGETINAYEI